MTPTQAALNHVLLFLRGIKLRSKGEQAARENLVEEIERLTAAAEVGEQDADIIKRAMHGGGAFEDRIRLCDEIRALKAALAKSKQDTIERCAQVAHSLRDRFFNHTQDMADAIEAQILALSSGAPPDKNPAVMDAPEAGHGVEPPTRGAVAPTFTQAQREAVAKAIYEMVGYDMPIGPGPKNLPFQAADAALSAAAEMGNTNPETPLALRKYIPNKGWPEVAAEVEDERREGVYDAYTKGVLEERERCAQVVRDWPHWLPMKQSLIAAILALKDKP